MTKAKGPIAEEPEDFGGAVQPIEPSDPFDPDALRADLGDDDIPVERILRHLAVRKPSRDDFIRVRPDAGYTLDVYMIERQEGIDKQQYLVLPAVARELTQDVGKRRIFTCVTRAGVPFLWPCKLPRPGNPSNSWSDSALEIAESAKEHWVRILADVQAKCYEEGRATAGVIPEPKWLDKTMRELLTLAFKDHIIETWDHDILRELRGEL